MHFKLRGPSICAIHLGLDVSAGRSCEGDSSVGSLDFFDCEENHLSLMIQMIQKHWDEVAKLQAFFLLDPFARLKLCPCLGNMSSDFSKRLLPWLEILFFERIGVSCGVHHTVVVGMGSEWFRCCRLLADSFAYPSPDSSLEDVGVS